MYLKQTNKKIADLPIKHKCFLMCYLRLKGFLKIILNVMKVIVLIQVPVFQNTFLLRSGKQKTEMCSGRITESFRLGQSSTQQKVGCFPWYTFVYSINNLSSCLCLKLARCIGHTTDSIRHAAASRPYSAAVSATSFSSCF